MFYGTHNEEGVRYVHSLFDGDAPLCGFIGDGESMTADAAAVTCRDCLAALEPVVHASRTPARHSSQEATYERIVWRDVNGKEVTSILVNPHECTTTIGSAVSGDEVRLDGKPRRSMGMGIVTVIMTDSIVSRESMIMGSRGRLVPQPKIGIPFAFEDEVTGERICPACGGRIAEEYDADGECLTSNYATHYQREHGEGGERS